MTEAAQEWFKKAERDYISMRREYRALLNPNYDSACFHAQQCAEKMLKGYLVQHGIRFAKTHDLRTLLKLSYQLHPEWKSLEKDAADLTVEAIESRYPGEDRTREDAKIAISICKNLRKAVQNALKSDRQIPLDL